MNSKLQQTIDAIQKKHHYRLDPDDPILVMLTLNDEASAEHQARTKAILEDYQKSLAEKQLEIVGHTRTAMEKILEEKKEPLQKWMMEGLSGAQGHYLKTLEAALGKSKDDLKACKRFMLVTTIINALIGTFLLGSALASLFHK